MWTWMIKDRIWGCLIHSGIWCYQATQQMWTIIPTSYFMAVGKTWISVPSLGCLEPWKLQNTVAWWCFLSTTLLIFRKINATDCHVITVAEIDRQRGTRDSRCFILVVIFRLHTGFIEGIDGWASAGINLLLILTANTFTSVYPTLGLRMFKLSVRGNRWSVKVMWRYLFSSDSAQVMGNSSCMVFRERFCLLPLVVVMKSD